MVKRLVLVVLGIPLCVLLYGRHSAHGQDRDASSIPPVVLEATVFPITFTIRKVDSASPTGGRNVQEVFELELERNLSHSRLALAEEDMRALSLSESSIRAGLLKPWVLRLESRGTLEKTGMQLPRRGAFITHLRKVEETRFNYSFQKKETSCSHELRIESQPHGPTVVTYPYLDMTIPIEAKDYAIKDLLSPTACFVVTALGPKEPK